MSNKLIGMFFLFAFVSILQALGATPEQNNNQNWALKKIASAQDVNFDEKCGGEFDPGKTPNADSPCRSLPGTFIVELLKIPLKTIDQRGLHIEGAIITAENGEATAVDLSNLDLGSNIWIERSIISGDFKISGAHLKHIFSVNRSIITGSFLAIETTSDSDVFLEKSDIRHETTFLNAQFPAGSLTLSGSRFRGKFNGSGLVVRHHIYATELSAGSGNVEPEKPAEFDDELQLEGAEISGDLDMTFAVLSKSFEGSELQVGAALKMRSAKINGAASLKAAKVGSLDFSDATLAQIDLSGLSCATMSCELNLIDVTWQCSANNSIAETQPASTSDAVQARNTWPLGDVELPISACSGKESLPSLALVGAKVGSLNADANSWPPNLHTEGFRFEHLTGRSANLSASHWIDWLERDQVYNAESYRQLAKALSSAGQNETANKILFAGREYERDQTKYSATWVWLTFLSVVEGYGIGLYTFRVLWSVIVLAIIGAVILYYSPYARRHSVAWRFGASLHRLLPVIGLSKEFEECFDSTKDDDKERRLVRWQIGFFSVFGMMGWVLGFLLLAALATLSQN